MGVGLTLQKPKSLKKKKNMKAIFVPLLLGLLGSSLSSYIPPYYEGQPTFARVASLDPPDFRGDEVYKIEFNLDAKIEMPQEGFIHRSWEDFKQFDHLLTTHLMNFGLEFPSQPTIENLDAYMKRVMEHSNIVNSHVFQDFLGINWSGKDLKFMQSLTEFMKVVIPPLYRAPDFAPEPPVFTEEDDCITSEETPFEVYVYLMAFRAQTHLQEYLKFFETFTNTYPAFAGLEDDSDVQPDGVSVTIPPHFNHTFVHFLPGGYLNGHTVRISYLGKSKFNFLDESRIREHLSMMYGDKNPKRILDIGTGPGFSAFVLSEMFPEAEIVAIDLAAPYIRMARRWQEMRNASNIQFYHANAEDLSWLESESFDFINYAYVLHEMPADNCVRVIREMYRLLREGGIMNGFEVPFVENELERLLYVEFNTWGHNWEHAGAQGPEPYIGEYENGVQLPSSLEAEGFSNIEQIEYSYFESIFLAQK